MNNQSDAGAWGRRHSAIVPPPKEGHERWQKLIGINNRETRPHNRNPGYVNAVSWQESLQVCGNLYEKSALKITASFLAPLFGVDLWPVYHRL